MVVDEGNYKIGTIFLKSNVTIELGQNGKISAQTDRKYYAEATYKQLYKDGATYGFMSILCRTM